MDDKYIINAKSDETGWGYESAVLLSEQGKDVEWKSGRKSRHHLEVTASMMERSKKA